ncbi:MAG: 3-phosphoshikimate 1-carboxyvinyltransferase [Candidatus Dasytiphilus stammeri]
MSDNITIQPIALVNGTINLPGSKSISNRVLLIAAQAHGITRLSNLLNSDDVRHMLQALRYMGVHYVLSEDHTVCEILGCGGPLHVNHRREIFLGNAGTAMRPLTAALCLASNDVVLTGEPRMKERPIGPLVQALRQGGAKINYLENDNYPPVHLFGGFRGGEIVIDGSDSSQFITALLMAAPLASIDTRIIIQGQLVSRPYIDITLNLLRDFGVCITNNQYRDFRISGNQKYQSPGEYRVEGDASSASYFLAAAAVKGGKVCVTGIGRNSIQGDVYFAEIIKQMGAQVEWNDNAIICQRSDELHSVNLDMNDLPDAAMTLAILSLFAKGTTRLSNIYNWRIKETDRLTAMAKELRKVGAEVVEGKDYICITPPKKFHYAEIDTYNDHRMAMCFSLIALASVPVTILNASCIKKTYPDYFHHLASIIHRSST